MKYYINQQILSDAYFLDILSRLSSKFNPNRVPGVESLNNKIFQELGVSFKQFVDIKEKVYSNPLIKLNIADKAFIDGLENLVDTGVSEYIKKHGVYFEAETSEAAIKGAVEALKDEFEGEGSDLSVSENGDTNSGVIQALIDDLKDRQADEVGRTVNLILKLNADKQRELLDEQKADSDDIQETMDETGLGGDDAEGDQIADGENPLEDGSSELNDDEASFEDDPFAEEAPADKKNDGKGSAEEDAPTLEDKKNSKKEGSGNPFEGFESMMLNGTNPLDQAGIEADMTYNGITGLLGDTNMRLILGLMANMKNPDLTLGEALKSTGELIGSHIYEFVTTNWKTLLADSVLTYIASQLAKLAVDFRLDKSLRLQSNDRVAKAQGSNKGMLHMTPEQYKKAYLSYESSMLSLGKKIEAAVKKDELLSGIEKMIREKTDNKNYKMVTIAEKSKEAANASMCIVIDVTAGKTFNSSKEGKQYLPMYQEAMNKIANIIEEEFKKLGANRNDFNPFITGYTKKGIDILTVGFTSNVIISQAFTESEMRDILEGMAETLAESNPSLGFRFMNDMDLSIGNEDNIGTYESLYNAEEAGLEGIISPVQSFVFTFRLALRKLHKYKRGENIVRRTLNKPADDYNKELKEMENIAKANAKYLDGVLRSKSKFLTWCLDVGAIKVIKDPHFVDGLAMVAAIDTVNPIEVDKENGMLTYKEHKIELSKVGVSKYKLMPFKNLGSVLLKACEQANEAISSVLASRFEDYDLYGGINPIESTNSDSGWVIVAHNNKVLKAATESLNTEITEYTDATEAIIYDPQYGFEPGAEGVITAFKNKYNSMSLIKSSIEMSSTEYQNLANEFKNYGKECFENLKVDIKNDPVVGLLGLSNYLKSNFEVKQDAKKRPMVLIYKTDKGLVPSSHWQKYENGDVSIQTQNTKIDALIKVIKTSIESYISETKFKGLSVFPVIAKDLTEAYAVIANPVEIKVESKVESLSLLEKYQPISGGFDQPVYGVESYSEMKDTYKVYNKILDIFKAGSKLVDKLKEKAQLDYVFGDRSYQACIESFQADPNNLIDRLTFKDGYIQVPLFTLDPSKTSHLYKNEFLIEANESIYEDLHKLGYSESNYHLINTFNSNPNATKPLSYAYVEFGYHNPSMESLSGEKLLTELADNYLVTDYKNDLLMETYKNDNARYGLLGLESEEIVSSIQHPFKVMTLAYNHLTKNGLPKLNAEYFLNKLYGVTPEAGVESITSNLFIDEKEASIMQNRSKYLTMQYLKSGLESKLREYSVDNIYNTMKEYMQLSLDVNGIDGIAYTKENGIVIGLESSTNIKDVAKYAINLQRNHPLPAYMMLDTLYNKEDNKHMLSIRIPLDLGNENLMDIPTILRKAKSTLEENAKYYSLKSVGDISLKNIYGYITKPLDNTTNQLQKHVADIMLAARSNTLKHAYNQYGVESYEYKNTMKEFEKSVQNVFSAYVSSIVLASALGMNPNIGALYEKHNI